MAALVDFIYIGECSVKEESLDQFVKSGKEFGLRGIEEVTLEGGHEEGEGEDEELSRLLFQRSMIGEMKW